LGSAIAADSETPSSTGNELAPQGASEKKDGGVAQEPPRRQAARPIASLVEGFGELNGAIGELWL